ncbi:MAG: type II toxin-antitoxin system VapB family antitoxin [Deltaproteobacteria bacterium]|nr:type II toxin-antitoxin system VapB family antitoxin [Deltaproteobacteria bacterium]
MRTSIDIPDSLLEEAQEVVGAKTKTQAIIMALTELIERRKSRRILELKGSLKEDYDYKSLRRKR